MISISAQRKYRRSSGRNAPTPERMAKADAPTKLTGKRYLVQGRDASSTPPSMTDPLQHWRDRNVISEAQHRAGRRFQYLYEKAALGGASQPGEKISACRRGPAATTPAATLARSELDAMVPLLGELDFKLLCNVLARGHDLAQEAPDLADGKAYVGRRIRDALNVLAMRDNG